MCSVENVTSDQPENAQGVRKTIDKNNTSTTTPNATPPNTTPPTTLPTQPAQGTSCVGENGLLLRVNSGPSTAFTGGKGPGPPQGSIDHNPPYQVTKPPQLHHHLEQDKNKGYDKKLNIFCSKNIKRKWREIKLTRDKKFEYILVIDYGVATSTNEKKRVKRIQEKKQQDKIRLLQSVDNREIVKEMSANKRQDFFTKLVGMKEKVAVDKNKKRMRDEEVQQEDKLSMKKFKTEDNKGDKNHKSDASEFQGSNINLTRNVGMQLTRNEMQKGRASLIQVPGGKVKKLRNIFQKTSSKEDIVHGNVRGQSSCLASLANRKPSNISNSLNAIGGDYEAKGERSNEESC